MPLHPASRRPPASYERGEVRRENVVKGALIGGAVTTGVAGISLGISALRGREGDLMEGVRSISRKGTAWEIAMVLTGAGVLGALVGGYIGAVPRKQQSDEEQAPPSEQPWLPTVDPLMVSDDQPVPSLVDRLVPYAYASTGPAATAHPQPQGQR